MILTPTQFMIWKSFNVNSIASFCLVSQKNNETCSGKITPTSGVSDLLRWILDHTHVASNVQEGSTTLDFGIYVTRPQY